MPNDALELDRLRIVLEQLPLAAAVFEGPDHVVSIASRAYRRMMGDRALVGRRAAEALPELVAQGLLDMLDEAFRSGGPVSASGVRVAFDADGDGAAEPHYVDFDYQPLRGPDGRVWGVAAGVVNVTQRERAEEALRANQRRLQQVLDALPVGVLLADEQGGLLWQNPASRRIWGGRLEEFAEYRAWWGDSGRPLLPEEWGLPRALAGQESSGEVIDIETFDGRRCTLLNSAATLRDDEGRIIGAVAVYEDITEARDREKRRTLLAAALEGLQEGVCITTPAGDLVYGNQAFTGMLELAGAAGGGRLQELAADEAPALDAALRTAAAQGGWSGRIRTQRRDEARETTLEILLGRVDGAGGGRELLFGIIRDISSQLHVERQLRQAERLASLGTLVGGVAHELNNPLSAVLGFTELLLMEERPPAEREDLQTIRREAERMARIVADLRLIARGAPEEAAAERVDLNDIVRHVLRTRAHSLRSRAIEVREDLAADLPAVVGDRARLEQALLNLVVNAEQALSGTPSGGRLIIRTRTTAQGATLQVVDNGPGIPARHLERIFDPFFTTKGPGEGTGLGLALVHTIIAEHRGEIRVDSEVGAGTAFRLDLPRAEAPTPEAAAPGEAAPAPAPSRRRVLVVDDENPVRRVVVRYLAHLGYETEEAADGRQALMLIDWADTPFDVIISDLRMPGLGGEALLARLAERGLADRLVFLTGDVANEQSVQALEALPVPVLGKPVSIEELSRAVEEVTRGRP